MQSTIGVTRERIAASASLIGPHIRRTPVIEIDGRDLGIGNGRLTLKLELLQCGGSFKTRGAFVNLLTRPVPASGVVAASGGNHAVAVAYVTARLAIPAQIFEPSVCSPVKIARIRESGAELVIAGDRYADALAASEACIERCGAMRVHAFDHVETMLGQGTIGMELEEQAPDLDTLLVPVGGGGLIGGIAAWYAGRIKVIGVEPYASPTLTRALEAGRPVDAETGGIAADSLAPRQIGLNVFPIAKACVHGTVLVTDEAIVAAQRQLWESVRVAAEPGGAAALAALTSGAYRPAADERVGIVISGGNSPVVTFAPKA